MLLQTKRNVIDPYKEALQNPGRFFVLRSEKN